MEEDLKLNKGIWYQLQEANNNQEPLTIDNLKKALTDMIYGKVVKKSTRIGMSAAFLIHCTDEEFINMYKSKSKIQYHFIGSTKQIDLVNERRLKLIGDTVKK